MDSQQINRNFKQNIGDQHQRALAVRDGTKTTSPGLAIRAWVEMDVNR